MKRIFFILLIFSLASCRILKSNKASDKEAGNVVKNDTTHVTKNETTTTTNSDWWREIIKFVPHDTFSTSSTLQPINHFYTQPVEIIREGGSAQQQINSVNLDSFRHSLLDSLYQKQTTTESKVKKGPTWLDIIGIVAICLVVIELIRWLITKKISVTFRK